MRKSFTRLFSIFVLLLGLSFQMAYGITFDGANSVPTDGNSNAKPTDFATKFVVAFDVVPVISDAGGTVVIYKGGGLYKTLPITKTSANVVVVGKTIEITHGITTFTAGEVYNVAITDGAITGLAAGALNSTVYDFTIGDYVAPQLLTAAASFTPAKGAVDVMGTLNGNTLSLVIPFNEAVDVPVATNDLAVYIYKEDGTVVDIIKVGKVGSTTLTGGGTASITVPVATTAIFQENTKYYVSIDAGAFVDASPNKNAFGGLTSVTTWTFTTRDNSAPAVSAKSVTAVTQITATLNVSLSEKGKYYYSVSPASAAAPSAAQVVAGTDPAKIVSGSKTVDAAATNVTAAIAGLSGGIAYKAYIVTENTVTVGSPVVGTTVENVSFTTVDNTAPLAVSRGSLTDASKKTNALYMVFNEQVIGGSGSLDLRKTSDESYVKTVAASAITSTQITTAADATKYSAAINDWVVVIDLGMTLPSQVAYYVVFPDGYIKDVAGNKFASGGAFIIPINKGDWNVVSSDFELPTVTVAFATPSSLTSDITITFNETVAKALGSTTAWSDVVALEQNNTPVAFTVLPAAAANTSVITLTPGAALTSNTVYTVKLRPNAVKDLNENTIVPETVYTVTTGDLDALTVQYGSSEGATVTTGLVANSTIKIDFNKAVKVNTTGTTWVAADATNLKPLITFSKGATAKAFTVTYDAATFTATVIPTDALVSNASDYSLVFDGTKIKDVVGTTLTSVTTGYTVKDYEAPVVTLSNSGTVTSLSDPKITITDANTISTLSASQVTFKEGSSSGANLAFSYAEAGGVITITPVVPLAVGKTYYYGIGASVTDLAGNVNAAKFASFTIGTATPTPTIVANTYTLNGSSQTPVDTKLVNIVPKTGNIVSVTVTFNDNIKETQSVAPYKTVSLTDGVGTWTANVTPTTVSGNTLTVDFNVGGPLASEAVCTLTLPAGIVQGSTAYDATPLFAQFLATKTILFDSKDVVKPVATANTPGAGATLVDLNTAIKIDFSEKVILGTGDILIKEGTTTVQTIPVNSTNVSLNAAGTTATITKTGDLPKYNTTYTLEIPSAAFTDDLSLNTLSALYSGTFTTLPNPAPSISSLIPADNSDMVALNTSISMTFDEEVEKNYTPGVLTLKGIYLIEKKDGNGQLVAPNYQFDADPASAGTDDDVLVASKYIDDSAVAISGNTVTVNFGVALAANKDYYILVAPEAFRDKSLGSPIPGLSTGIISYGLWNFTTKDVNAPTITYSYTKRADNKVAITSDITITFSKPIEKVSGSAINSSDIATLFTLTKISGPGTTGVKAFIGEINADKTVVKILNSSLVTLGEMTELSNYTIALNTGAIRGVTNHVVLAGTDAFTTSDYTAPVVTPSIVAAIADVKKDEATVQFVSTDNMNLASVYYTIQAGDNSTAAPSAAVVKAGVMDAIVGASPKTTTHKFTGLTEETSYVVWAVAVDEAGNESAVSKVVFITDDVTKPTLAVKPTSFDAAGKLTFTFSEAVSPVAASVRILDKASMTELAVLGLNAVAGHADQLITDAFTPAITNTLVEYYVEIDKDLVADVPVVAGDAVNTFDGLFRTDLMVTSKDATAPVFVSTVPALPATGVDLNFSIKLNFSEAVQKATTIAPNAFLVEKWNGTAYEAYEVIDPAYVVTNGTSEVTVTLTRALSSTTMYRLTADLASFKDMSGNAHAAGTVSGTITTKDVVAPAVTFLPAKNATAVTSTTTLTITFAEAIRLLDNSAIDKFDLDSLVWVKKAGVPVTFSAAMTTSAVANDQITITIPATANDQTYTYGFKAKFEDASDNAIPADMASFSTVTTSPAAQYLTWTPVKAVAPATSTWLGSTAAITLNFSNPVFTLSAVAADNNLPVTAAYLKSTALKVYDGATDITSTCIFTVVDNKTFTVAPATNWTSSALIKVEVQGGTLQVNEGNLIQLLGAPFDASVYKAEDIIAPKVDATKGAPYTAGFYPAKVGLAGVSPVVAKTETLKLYFDEDVKVGTGKVEIYRWDGVLAQPASLVSVAADKRTVSLGDLSVLPTNQEYYIVVNPAIVVDVNDGMAYAGLTDVKVWKFILKDDAVPQVQAYMPVISNTPITTDLTLNFDRNVALTGAGYVAIYESAAGGDAIQIWRGADNGTTNALSVSGSTATVNISDLAVNTQYFVEVAAGTFKGATSGENQLAISRNDWSFTTEVNAAPVIIAGGYMPALNALQVDVDSNLEITFDMPVQAGTGNIQLHAANGSMVYNFDVKGTDVTFAGDKVTVNLPTMMITSQYYVIIPATAIRNTTYTPEYFGGITVPYFWKFNTTTDVVAPTVVADSYSPMGMVPTPEGITFSIKFSEVVMAGTGAITIKNTDDNTVTAVTDVMFNADSTVTFNAATPLTFAKYQVLVPADAIKDGNNNFYDPTALAWNFEISDLTAPSVAGLSPADGTVGLPGINDLSITFSEPVMLSSATAEIKVYKQGLLGNSLVFNTPITAANLSADMKTVTVTTDSLADRTSYMVLVDANLVKDVAGNEFAGIADPTVWNYETGDFTGPVVASMTTASLTNAKNTFTVDIMFDENVTGVADNVTATNGTVTVTGSGKSYVATVTAEDAAVVVLTVGTGVKDANDNGIAAPVSKTIIVGDNTAPTVVVTDPATPVATVFTIGLTFSEPVSGGASAVTVTGGTLLDVTGTGTEYEVKVSAAEQTEVTVVLTDAIKDLSPNANKFAGKTLVYTTGDFTAPQLLTMSPSADEVIADNHPVLKMSFNENVKVGTGSLKIYKVATTTPALTIPITADMISGKDVAVSYAATQTGLDKNTRYYVLVDGAAINDNAGNAFVGVTDATAWTFKTGANFATSVNPDVNVSLEFKVYPNPFVDVVNIVSPSSLSKIVVTNIAGQVAKQIVNPSNSIQLNELRSGIYFVSMYDMDNKVVNTAKIVKR
ncbi:MAG: Ig-like domain-containing protein [Prolixibacteraceae bacterium]